MGKQVLFLLCILTLGGTGCGPDYMPGFDFKLFRQTPVARLARAVETDDTAAIEKILRDKSIDVDYQEPKFGQALLALSIVNNKLGAAGKLLQHGASPNKRTKHDTNALFDALTYTFNCDTIALKLLIRYGADVNAIHADTEDHNDLIETPLMAAIGPEDCIDRVKVLVAAGADINKCTYYPGYGALTDALIMENMDVVKYLIVDKNATIPKYCYKRDLDTSNIQYLTVTDMLNGGNYGTDSSRYRLRTEILVYMKSKGLK